MQYLFSILLCTSISICFAQAERPDSSSRKTVNVSGKYFSRCDFMPYNAWIEINDLSIDFVCFKHEIVAKDRQGKEKWSIDTEKLSSTYVSMFRKVHNGSFDVVMVLDDGERYWLKSKSGRVKHIKKKSKQ